MEISDVRRRLLQTIERAKRDAAARRAAADEAGQAYNDFLTGVATPLVHMFVTALRAEGYLFQVFTPAGSLRIASEKSRDDYIELTLDTSGTPPAVVGRVSWTRGRRATSSERPIREGATVSELTEEDVLRFLLDEIGPFVER